MAVESGPSRHPAAVGTSRKGRRLSVHERLLRNQRLRNLVPPSAKAAFAENRVRPAPRRAPQRGSQRLPLLRPQDREPVDPQGLRRPRGLPRHRSPNVRVRAAARRRRAEPLATARSRSIGRSRRAASSHPCTSPHEGFAALPKPEPWRAFFVLRDPRDVVVSWYFSSIGSHPTNSSRGMQRAREHLAALDEEQGLIDSIRRLAAVWAARCAGVLGRCRRTPGAGGALRGPDRRRTATAGGSDCSIIAMSPCPSPTARPCSRVQLPGALGPPARAGGRGLEAAQGCGGGLAQPLHARRRGGIPPRDG